MGKADIYVWLSVAAGRGAGLITALSRQFTLFFTLLPSVPRLPTRRSRLADGLFEFFLLLSRCTALTGAILGVSYAGWNDFKGFAIGLLAGWAIGFWMRRSLGMRSWDLTRGFYVRLLERGNGNRPKLLESLIEKLRGDILTPPKCRMIAGAYAEMQRKLHLCNSLAERRRSFDELERKVATILYGQPAATSGREARPAPQVGNRNRSFLTGPVSAHEGQV
jgi:hypothetical protein